MQHITADISGREGLEGRGSPLIWCMHRAVGSTATNFNHMNEVVETRQHTSVAEFGRSSVLLLMLIQVLATTG